jgi:UPF0755 protein
LRKPKKILLGILAFIVLATLGGLGGLYLVIGNFASTPSSQALGLEPRYFYLLVERGSSFDQVANDLYREGAISSIDKFKMLGRLRGASSQIKAGEFEFNTAWTPEQVLDQLVNGRSLLHRLTIPEGLPWWEVARLLEENGFARAEDVAELVRDPKLLQRYGIPFATAEGFLYPETYMLNKGRVPTKAHAQSAMQTMLRTFWSKTAPLWNEAGVDEAGSGGGVDVSASVRVIASVVPRYARENPAEVKRLVILASLVEKESAVVDERPRIAGVYSNRLRIDMPLQCDPTIIYGLGPGFAGKILRPHLLDSANVYNTYRFYGLPPGPICSPGLGAMQAAFHPENNSFLYFVATGNPDGRHTFSRTLREHNAAVEQYRANLRAQPR